MLVPDQATRLQSLYTVPLLHEPVAVAVRQQNLDCSAQTDTYTDLQRVYESVKTRIYYVCRNGWLHLPDGTVVADVGEPVTALGERNFWKRKEEMSAQKIAERRAKRLRHKNLNTDLTENITNTTE